MYKSAKMPNEKGATLYICQGIKSKLYALGLHVRQTVTGKDGVERPSQSTLYLGMYDYYEDALAAFDETLNKKVLNWR